MNLFDSLHCLATLAEHRHFGRAAPAGHIAQPALLNAIRALEDSLGETIARRGRQYEGLTPKGEPALTHARHLLQEADGLRQALAIRAGAIAGAHAKVALENSVLLVVLVLVDALETDRLQTAITRQEHLRCYGCCWRVSNRGTLLKAADAVVQTQRGSSVRNAVRYGRQHLRVLCCVPFVGPGSRPSGAPANGRYGKT